MLLFAQFGNKRKRDKKMLAIGVLEKNLQFLSFDKGIHEGLFENSY